jgi:hypothetical protein
LFKQHRKNVQIDVLQLRGVVMDIDCTVRIRSNGPDWSVVVHLAVYDRSGRCLTKRRLFLKVRASQPRGPYMRHILYLVVRASGWSTPQPLNPTPDLTTTPFSWILLAPFI